MSGPNEKESGENSVVAKAVCPPGWVFVTIGKICSINPGLPNLVDDDTLVSFVPMAAVSDDTGMITNPEVRPYREVRRGYTQFANGDVIFAKITPCMENGKSAIAQSLRNGVACGSTEFYVLRPGGAIIPEYLHGYIRQKSFRNEAHAAMRGAGGHTRVPRHFIENAVIPLPPIGEQKRIMGELSDLYSKENIARSHLGNLPIQLNHTRESLLAAAYVGDLTKDFREANADDESSETIVAACRHDRKEFWEEKEVDSDEVKLKELHWKERYKPALSADIPVGIKIPSTWSWAAAEELTQPGRPILYGILKPGPHDPNGIPYVRVVEMKTGTIDVSKLPKVNTRRAARFERAKLKTGDILISKDGTIGRVAIVPPELEGGYTTQHVLRLSPSQRMLGRYISRVIEAPMSQKWLVSNKTGVALQGVNVGDFRRLAVPVPPPSEQREIVRRLDEAFERLDAADLARSSALSHLDELEQSLLSKAFRGDLVPQNPGDEPAMNLVTRLLAEAANQLSKGKPMPRKTTQSNTRDVRPILEVLQHANNGLSPEQLFQQSGRDESDLDQVERFFVELRQLVREQKVNETRPTSATVLITSKI